MKTPHGSRIFPGCEERENMMRLEYFIFIFPPNQLTEIIRLFFLNTHRIVCADSYFALVTASELFYLNRMKFIGVVKT